MGRPRVPAEVRFWSRVVITDECWTWGGSLDRHGYGQFKVEPMRAMSAHRYAYTELVGPIPDRLQIDHLCRNRACVNPAHMEPVTPRENTLRGVSLQAANARKTRCPKGHRLTGANLYRQPSGSRACRRCHREAQRRWRGRVESSS